MSFPEYCGSQGCHVVWASEAASSLLPRVAQVGTLEFNWTELHEGVEDTKAQDNSQNEGPDRPKALSRTTRVRGSF